MRIFHLDNADGKLTRSPVEQEPWEEGGPVYDPNRSCAVLHDKSKYQAMADILSRIENHKE